MNKIYSAEMYLNFLFECCVKVLKGARVYKTNKHVHKTYLFLRIFTKLYKFLCDIIICCHSTESKPQRRASQHIKITAHSIKLVRFVSNRCRRHGGALTCEPMHLNCVRPHTTNCGSLASLQTHIRGPPPPHV